MDETIIEDIASMRVRKNGRLSPFQWVCIYGFGTTEKRNLVVRALRYALGSVMLHGSNVGAGRWEALLLMEKCRADSPEFERLMDKFHVSMGAVDLETYLGPQMLTAYERIESGSSMFGTLHLKRNRLHRQNLESFIRRKREVQHTMRAEEEMGRAFTLPGMLHLHREYRVVVVNREAAELELGFVQRGLADALVNMRIAMSMVEHSGIASAPPSTGPMHAPDEPVQTTDQNAAEESVAHSDQTLDYQWYRISNAAATNHNTGHNEGVREAVHSHTYTAWPDLEGPHSPPGWPPGSPHSSIISPPSPPRNDFRDDGSILERIMRRLRDVCVEVQDARTAVMRVAAGSDAPNPLPHGMGAFVF